MAQWKVTGTRTVPVFVIVEADSEDEAFEKAEEEFGWEVDEEKAEMNDYPPEIQDAEEV